MRAAVAELKGRIVFGASVMDRKDVAGLLPTRGGGVRIGAAGAGAFADLGAGQGDGRDTLIKDARDRNQAIFDRAVISGGIYFP